jgi:hypothetical protein
LDGHGTSGGRRGAVGRPCPQRPSLGVQRRLASGVARFGDLGQISIVAASITYDENATLEEARDEYFARNGFGDDGGYSSPYVKVKFAGIPIKFPNTPGRVAAVRYHDLHHLVTEYATDNPGEAAIGAWELASGCTRFPAAWVLNAIAMAMGLFRAPRSTFRAYVRGRHSANLYDRPFDETLLHTTVGDARTELGLRRPPVRPTAADLGAFAFHAALSVMIGTVVISPLLAAAIGLGWLLL